LVQEGKRKLQWLHGKLCGKVQIELVNPQDDKTRDGLPFTMLLTFHMGLVCIMTVDTIRDFRVHTAVTPFLWQERSRKWVVIGKCTIVVIANVHIRKDLASRGSEVNYVSTAAAV